MLWIIIIEQDKLVSFQNHRLAQFRMQLFGQIGIVIRYLGPCAAAAGIGQKCDINARFKSQVLVRDDLLLFLFRAHTKKV